MAMKIFYRILQDKTARKALDMKNEEQVLQIELNSCIQLTQNSCSSS